MFNVSALARLNPATSQGCLSETTVWGQLSSKSSGASKFEVAVADDWCLALVTVANSLPFSQQKDNKVHSSVKKELRQCVLTLALNIRQSRSIYDCFCQVRSSSLFPGV